MDIELATPESVIYWKQAGSPWNRAEKKTAQQYEVKNASFYRFFCGVGSLETPLYCNPHPNPLES